VPEYLAPGVYVEETSVMSRTIEGLSTSTAGFVGPTRFGPVTGAPELLTSYSDFERVYGGLDPLVFSDTTVPNDLAHAVRGFFENGGQRLHVSRTFQANGTGDEDPPPGVAGFVGDQGTVRVRARHPGAAGNVDVVFEVRTGPNVLSFRGREPHLAGIEAHATVLVLADGDEHDRGPAATGLYWLEERRGTEARRPTFRLRRPDDGAGDAPTVADLAELGRLEVRVVTLVATVAPLGRSLRGTVWESAPDPRHRQHTLGEGFAVDPSNRSDRPSPPIVVEAADGEPIGDGVSLLEGIFGEFVDGRGTLAQAIRAVLVPSSDDGEDIVEPGTSVSVSVRLRGGDDGAWPEARAYAGDAEPPGGLRAFEALADIAIVAAPGSTRDGLTGRRPAAARIQQAVIAHCERMRDPLAVLDPPDRALVDDIRAYCATVDSEHAALYYPWVRIPDPIGGGDVTTPPSGFVAGVHARNVRDRGVHARNGREPGVHTSPGNTVVRLAIGLERSIGPREQVALGREGVNLLRLVEPNSLPLGSGTA
jgi:uncharacterized protein